jgi:hypothetical protein
MKLWAILKTLIFIAGVYYLIKYISALLNSKRKPNGNPGSTKSNGSNVVQLKEKGKGRLPDGSEYTEFE